MAVCALADIILGDLDAPIVIDAARLISKSQNSGFGGRRPLGRVLMTLVDGRVGYWAG